MLQPLCTRGRLPYLNVLRRNGVGPSWYRLPPIPESAQAARLFATAKVEGEDEGYVDDVAMVTSELATNAIKHAIEHGDPAKGTAPGIWLGVQASLPSFLGRSGQS